VWEWIDHGLLKTSPDGKEYYAYGGEFGEETGVHDNHFVCDGLLLPDRRPSPGLLEYKKVIEPLTISDAGEGTISIKNKFDFATLDHLAFTWRLETDGKLVSEGKLDVPSVPAGETVKVKLPALSPPAGESIVTVVASLAKDDTWAKAGHEVTFAQVSVPASATNGDSTASLVVPSVDTDASTITLGPATFDAKYGALIRLGDMPVEDGRLDVWRAPTDNDCGGEMTERYPDYAPVTAEKWRAAGLFRMHHRLDSVAIKGGSLIVTTRVASAILDRGLKTVYTWTSDGDAVKCAITVVPDGSGSWDDLPLPRLGVRLALPRDLDTVAWYGCGPGEAYPDSRKHVRVGQYKLSVGEMQTPYTHPQENGSRIDVRTATITSAGGKGIRIDGAPLFALTARPWTSDDLDAAKHPFELTPRGRLYVNIDYQQSGVGSASCGPGVLPQYKLLPVEGQVVEFGFSLRAV
jgi:beta-galactosidase